MSPLDWLDHRTGYRAFLRDALYEAVPGGARWRYVWGSTLTFAIVVQFITGIILWAHYSPSAITAWESVYYIQEQMTGGWFLRGVHHFTAQLMVPLLVLHLLQVLIDGAYKAPREINYWFGLGLLLLTLGLSLTGYLLPWDQKGYWATKVATNLLGGVPVVGEWLQRSVVGGDQFGHLTLTRFFALHAGVLPAVLILFIALHVYLFRRHGLTPKLPLKRRDAHFWPDQVLCDSVACLAVIAAAAGLTVWFRGSELGAPANPGELYPGRPDWYFMFLFQFLKYFPGGAEVWGAYIIPGAVFLFLALMPFLGNWRAGHVLNLAFIFAGLAGFGVLTSLAYIDDSRNPGFKAGVHRSHLDAVRAKELARKAGGIPPSGALAMLRDDPQTQGPRIFAAQCASCHPYGGHDGMGGPLAEKPSAADLEGFGSREWLRAFLDPAQIETTKFWGETAFVKPPEGKNKSKMVKAVTEDIAEYSAEEKAQLEKTIIALSAEARLPSQRERDAADAALIEAGVQHFDELGCVDCHKFRGKGSGSGPDLTGWASRQWLVRFLHNPAHEDFYGKRNDRMPPLGERGELSPRELEMVAMWLRGEN
jgi:ubiquinol-cytochrome c reductase cytochrome b subunit